MNWICDPGHAWLKVSLKRLFKSGVADKISNYSYLRSGYAYLEEDQDAWVFLQAIGRDTRNGIKESHTNNQSRVRNYFPYSLENAIKLKNYYY